MAKSDLSLLPSLGLNENNVVNPHFFINMVNWLLDFCTRNTCETFTAIGIRLHFASQADADVNQARMELLDCRRLIAHVHPILRPKWTVT